jgi:ubiquinone/menaquinone biosynthesis C-methylase UbiE
MPKRFESRSTQAELMDDFNVSGEIIHKTLTEIDTINRWLGGNNVTITGIALLLQNNPGPVTIADLGCGSGAMLKLIDSWATKNQSKIFMKAVDANPSIVSFARFKLKELNNVTFLPLNIFSDDFRKLSFDIVVATLFFHHFTTDRLISFFRQLKSQVKIGIVINDIHRHWFAYHSIRLITKYFSRSSMVQYDAPLSVLRSFSKKELTYILQEAGLTNFTIRWRWAFRWQVIIKI